MKEKLPKLSIIVPVFNTAKYIEKCLDSLLKQEYPNIEIIVVEDKSTDNSRKVLKKYEDNEKIKIFYNENNSGLSYVRNKALENATGDYIGYIDSDDYIDSNFYSNMMNRIIKENADMAISDMKVVFENQNNREVIDYAKGEGCDKLAYINTGLAASACNKVFKRELIEKYKFSEGKVNEDLAVIIPTIVNSKKIVYLKNNYYYYIQRDNSIQNSRFSDKRFDIFYGVDLTLERIKGCKDYEKIRDAIIFNQIIVLLLHVVPKESNLLRRQKIIKKYSKLSKKYNIVNNYYLNKFIAACGKKHQIYYKLLVKFVYHRMYLFANLIIFMAQIAAHIFNGRVIKKNITNEDLIKLAIKQSKMKDEVIKVSVVIPNYNYENFLNERVYSILNQNYKIHELIILDDKSKDNSVLKINEIKDLLKDYLDIKVVINEENSGTPFKQWLKGFSYATGDYVWIAEADDYCQKNLLKNLIKPIFKNKNIYISYSDTAFVDSEGKIFLKTIKNEIDIQKTGHFDNSHINNGLDELKNYTFLNCTIANVSSAIIKNSDYTKELQDSLKLRQAGDWLFYIKLMQKGDVAYTSKVLNYYRVHGENVSSTMNYKKHIDEILFIYEYLEKTIKITKEQKEKMKERINFLKKTWKVD